jgi:O-antigen/teichoic acid export membrane protein
MDNSEKKRVVKNIAWLTISKIIVLILSIITITVIPRYLGVEAYGQLNFALAFVSLFVVFCDMGLSTLALRDVSKDPKKLNKYFNSFLPLILILNLIVFIVICLCLFFLGKSPIVNAVIIIQAATLIVNTIAGYFLRYTDALQKMKYNSVYSVISKASFVLFMYLMIFLNLHLIGIAWVYLFSSVVAGIYAFFIIKKYVKISLKPLKSNIKYALQKTKIAWPFALSGLFGVIYFSSDKFLISLFIGDYQVGLYSVAYSFIGFLLGLLTIFFTAFFPVISKYVKTNLLDSIVSKFSKIIYLLAVPMCFGGICYAKDIIRLVYGKDFVAGYISFQIIMIFFLFCAIDSFLGQIITAYNKQKYQFKLVLIAAITNVVLNVFFIPKWGIIGAAITTVIAELIIFIGLYTYIKNNKFLNQNIFKQAIIPGIASVIMIISLFYINKYWLLNLGSFTVLVWIGIGAIIYSVIILLTKYITKKDIVFVKETLLKR